MNRAMQCEPFPRGRIDRMYCQKLSATLAVAPFQKGPIVPSSEAGEYGSESKRFCRRGNKITAPLRPTKVQCGFRLRLELPKLAQHLRNLAQLVARWARLQPSCFNKKVLGLQQPSGRFSGDLHVRHGVPPSRLSMTCVDDQAGSPRYDDAPTRSGSSTQASLANQACSVWQIRQRVRPKNTGLRRKLSQSVLMPVGIACPVCGHLTMTIPM